MLENRRIMTAGALSPLLGEFQIHTRDAPKALHLFVIRPTALQCSAASVPGNAESRLNIIDHYVQNQYASFRQWGWAGKRTLPIASRIAISGESKAFSPPFSHTEHNSGEFQPQTPPDWAQIRKGSSRRLPNPLPGNQRTVIRRNMKDPFADNRS